jgi:hypothetical protein
MKPITQNPTLFKQRKTWASDFGQGGKKVCGKVEFSFILVIFFFFRFF